MLYQSVEQGDEVGQGRMVIVAIMLVFVVAWALDLFITPGYIVPGFLFDTSHTMMAGMIGEVFQLVFVGSLLLLLRAGVAWLRFVLGAYLLIVGLALVVFSMMVGVFAGGQLILGSVFLASGGALSLSTAVMRYLEDRRQRGVPWLRIGLSILELNPRARRRPRQAGAGGGPYRGPD